MRMHDTKRTGRLFGGQSLRFNANIQQYYTTIFACLIMGTSIGIAQGQSTGAPPNGSSAPGSRAPRPGFGGPLSPGGFRGQGRPNGQGMGMMQREVLTTYLDLTAEQKQKLEHLTKTVVALRKEGLAMPAFMQLKLTKDQVGKIAAGEKVTSVLTSTQKKVLAANQRPRFGGPGFPGPNGRPGMPQPGRNMAPRPGIEKL